MPETAFERDVGILAAPDHEEFALDVGGAVKGVVTHALAETGFVDVSRVETCSGDDIGIHGGAESEMAADTDAHGSDAAGAVGTRLEVVDGGACVVIVAGDWLGGLELVAAVGAGLVVGEDGSGGLELVIDLGHGDDVAVTSKHGCGASDGSRDLNDFGVEDDARITARGGGANDVRSHGAAGCVQGYVFVVDDDHSLASLRSLDFIYLLRG